MRERPSSQDISFVYWELSTICSAVGKKGKGNSLCKSRLRYLGREELHRTHTEFAKSQCRLDMFGDRLS